ncbi:MAG: putative CoA-binding protein, partial [Kiritimatiellia bacterium]
MSNVIVLGASAKPERYANQAVRLLVKHGHTVIP